MKNKVKKMYLDEWLSYYFLFVGCCGFILFYNSETLLIHVLLNSKYIREAYNI